MAACDGGLTPRSSGAPPAGRQARSGGTRYIFASPGLASCRRRTLSSNVRPQKTAGPGAPRASGSAAGHMASSGRQTQVNSLFALGWPRCTLVMRWPVVCVFHRGSKGGLRPVRFGQLLLRQLVGQPRGGCSRSGYNACCRGGIPSLSRRQACSFSLWRQESGSLPPPLPSHASSMPELRSNPSLKRSPNGVAHWPSSAGPSAHFALAVQHATPSVPA